MFHLSLILLVSAAIGGVIWGFHPNRMSPLGWFLLGAVVTYGFLSALLPERILKRRITRREPLSFDEIYRTSFRQLPYPRDLVEEVWNELAHDLTLDASKLRPADRFGVELSVKGFPLVDLSETVNARLKVLIRLTKASPVVAGKASSIKTLSDYVKFACEMGSQRQTA